MSDLLPLRADLAEAEAFVQEVKDATPPLDPVRTRLRLKSATRRIRTVLEKAIRLFLLGPGSTPPPPPPRQLRGIGNLMRAIKRKDLGYPLLTQQASNTLAETSKWMKANEDLDRPPPEHVERWLAIAQSFLDALQPILAKRETSGRRNT